MANIKDIFHFQRVSPRLAIGGQPHANQFATLRDSMIATVVHITVVGAPYTLKNEQEIVETLGMNYLPLTIDFAAPDIEDYVLFRDIMRSKQHNSTYVHCSAGFVSSAMTFLYRVIEEHTPVDRAMVAVGETWKPNATWQQFINTTLSEYGIAALPFPEIAREESA